MKQIVVGLVALTATLFTAAGFGQADPSQPIRIVVPFPTGSLADGVARLIGPKLAEGLGQPAVVQNKAEAEGSLGAAEVAKASADGHTLLLIPLHQGNGATQQHLGRTHDHGGRQLDA